MSAENKQVVSTNKAQDTVSNFQSGVSNIFSTIKQDTREGQVKLLSAVTDAAPLSENLNKVINLRHVVMQATSLTDEKTGEVSDVVRIILIDDEDNAYAAISEGMLKSLQNIFAIMGSPESWTEPLPIEVVEKRGRSGYRFMTVKIA